MSVIQVEQTAHLKRPTTAERLAVVLMIVIFTVSLPNEWFITRSDAEASGGIFVQFTFLSFAGLALLGSNGNWHLFKDALFREPLLPTLMGLFVLSTIWSEEPFSTLSTTVVISITCGVAIYLLLRFPLSEILYLIGISLAVALVINYVMVFAFPASGLQSDTGGIDDAWSGVYRSRNTLGRVAVLSTMIFAFNVRLRRSLFLWPALTVLAIAQVLGTGSATSLGSLLAMTALIFTFMGFRGRKTLYGATAVAMFTVFSIVVGAAATNISAATALVGRDATFTGRLPLWTNSIEHGIAHRPLTGYGYGGFWTGGGEDFDVLIRSNFEAPHAHNAFIDAWLNAGPLAALCLVGIYVRGLFWATRNIRRDPTVLGLFPAGVIAMSMTFSLSETGFVGRSVMFICLVVGIVVAAENKGVQRPFLPAAALTKDNKPRQLSNAGVSVRR